MARPQVVFVLGGPGAGKGTQCEKIVEKHKFVHLSAGDLLRAERKREGSEVGEQIESYISQGQLVPVAITVKLLKNAMEEAGWEGGKFLIDGFPRNTDNVEGWAEVIDGKTDDRFCLFFDCPESVMEERLTERGKTSGRSDDNVDVVRKRFQTYIKETQPIVDNFRKEGKLKTIMADRSIDEVWADVDKLFTEEFVAEP